MIIEKNRLQEYLGKQLSDLEGTLSQKKIKKLEQVEQRIKQNCQGSLIDYLFIEHQKQGKSLRTLAKELYVSLPTISLIFNIYQLPKLTPAEAVRKNWEDKKFRKKQAEATREMLDKRWEDKEFRKKQAEATRKARLSNIPKIKGYRTDIQRDAKTTAEANLMRIILYCGREELTKRTYELKVQSQYKNFFKSKTTRETLDILVKDSRGNLVGYKILPKPQQKSYAKAEMLKERYNIRLEIITERKYQRLEEWFKEKINSHQRLAGWETKKDNLKTNPIKYS